jgi:GNAT superfamily N-acetyltransferase
VSEDAETLAEMARNRGLKLVRSRVRTPTKRAFGKFGLTDDKGAKLLGLDGKHPSATAEEVEQFLRKGLVSDWAGSLGVTPPKARKPRRVPPKETAPPPPKPKVRTATSADGEAIATLAGMLDHSIDAKGVARRLKAIATPQLVATVGSEVIGLCGLDRQIHVHREAPVGRITILAVAEATRGKGIGKMLVAEAERRLARLGCGMIEITSNNRLTKAHHYYATLGYEQRSQRFVKTL